MKFADYYISKYTTIKESMKIIDSNKRKILFVVDEDHLLGALTDGDIRRYLLAGGSIDDNAIKAANCSPKVANNHEDAKKLYHSHNCVAVPIIDSNNRIMEIYIGDDSFTYRTSRLNAPVVINAGGKGSRLDPFTRVLPKPLIPVGDMPIIEHIMDKFTQFGCDNFHIIANYKKELLKAYFSETDHKYNISWYDENKPLGTGGGLSLLKGRINETFFFSNCDILLESNFESVLDFHRKNQNDITMICAYKNVSIPYGVIQMGKNGSIEDMREKPELSFLTNTGVYVVEPTVLDDIDVDKAITFPEIISMQMEKGRRGAVFPIRDGEWLDMGELEGLKNMNAMIQKQGLK